MNKYVTNKDISSRILNKNVPLKQLLFHPSPGDDGSMVHGLRSWKKWEDDFPCFTVGQLNELIYKNIPEYIDIYVYIKNNKWCVGYYNNNNNGNSELIVEDTEADAKGLLLLDLIDSNIISIESIVL